MKISTLIFSVVVFCVTLSRLQAMPAKKDCTFSVDGCNKRGPCPFFCGKCAHHCKLSCPGGVAAAAIKPAVEPRKRRGVRDETDEKIAASAINATPLKQKRADPDMRSAKDFDGVVPLPDRLNYDTKVDSSSGKTTMDALIEYGRALLHKLGESFAATPNSVLYVQDALCTGVGQQATGQQATEGKSKLDKSAMKAVADCIRMMKSALDTKGEAFILARALIVHHFTEKELSSIQELEGIPTEEQLVLARYSRTLAGKQYQQIFGGTIPIEPVLGDEDEANVARTKSIISDELVQEAVSFIVHHCSLLSWGTKKVPNGTGAWIDIPNLTRQDNPEEFWNLYAEMKGKQKESFREIVGHTGPLLPNDDAYINSRFNVEVLWSDETTTHESLFDFSKDAPVECAVYGIKKELRDERGWVGIINRISKSTIAKRKLKPSTKAFRGGRKMMGRTSFLDLVRSLTGGDEKLITAVDYVRGELVHTPVDRLQLIINDIIDDPDQKKELTVHLTVLSNFLKNQYKNHAGQDKSTSALGTHGLLHGLTPPKLPPQHYSTMTMTEIDLLLSERLQSPDKGAKNMKGKIALLERMDISAAADDSSTDDTTSKSATDNSDDNPTDKTSSSVNCGSDSECSGSEGEVVVRALEDMGIVWLRAEVRRLGLDYKGIRIAGFADAIRLHRELTSGDTSNQTSTVESNMLDGSIADESVRCETESADNQDSTDCDGTLDRSNTTDNDDTLDRSNTDESARCNTDGADNQDFDDSSDSAESLRKEMEQLGIDDDCLGCVFLHFFMLDELPNAVKKFRNEGNAARVDDALQYISDSHEKFMLYQGHVSRTANQSAQLEKMNDKLKQDCEQSRNTTPQDLWVIIDFKMKWEAMYLREKQTENYAKRGTSWHGVYLYYYVWDSKLNEAVKCVAKLDQILEGTNEQSGMTVLALIEAMLVYIKHEFPGANVKYMQSDNAQYYHVKEMVLSIPQLNARMKKTNGPQIINIVHTETQDGKSLLDAHFAHATALIKRYLRRIRQNRQNQVTSPGELVSALSNRGGLQNCGVQLVFFDGTVTARLLEIKMDPMMVKVSKKMKEYFSRCNEINFFPANDLEDGKVFCVRALAYSGVGAGATFKVDLLEGTVSVVEGDGSMDVGTESDELNDSGDDMAEVTEDDGDNVVEIVEDDDEPEVLEAMSLLAVERLIADDMGDNQDKSLVSTMGMNDYWSPNLFTGVKVERIMGLGKVLSTQQDVKRQTMSVESRGDVEMECRMDIVSRGVRHLSAHSFDTFGIRAGSDDTCAKEFELAKDFAVPEDFSRGVGWARRPPRGRMYGSKYLGKYKVDIMRWFLEGVDDKTKKRGPGVMLELLVRKYPGVYRLPTFIEIQSYIGQLFKTQKDGNLQQIRTAVEGGGDVGGIGDDEDEYEEEDEIAVGHDEELECAMLVAKRVVDQFGGLIMPTYVLQKVSEELHEMTIANETKKELKKYIMKLRNKWLKKRKRCIIG